jgi:membrane-associated phospholipid phosphatase
VAWLVILLVGFSRIYLGTHYLSDVLAAIAAGVAWLALCLTLSIRSAGVALPFKVRSPKRNPLFTWHDHRSYQ